jgi:hypothetical protein
MLLSTEGDALSSFTENSPLAWALCAPRFRHRDAIRTGVDSTWSKEPSLLLRFPSHDQRANPSLLKNHYFLATTTSNMPVSTTFLLSSRIPSQDLSMKAYLARWLHTLKSRVNTENLGSHAGSKAATCETARLPFAASTASRLSFAILSPVPFLVSRPSQLEISFNVSSIVSPSLS